MREILKDVCICFGVLNHQGKYLMTFPTDHIINSNTVEVSGPVRGSEADYGRAAASYRGEYCDAGGEDEEDIIFND